LHFLRHPFPQTRGEKWTHNPLANCYVMPNRTPSTLLEFNVDVWSRPADSSCKDNVVSLESEAEGMDKSIITCLVSRAFVWQNYIIPRVRWTSNHRLSRVLSWHERESRCFSNPIKLSWKMRHQERWGRFAIRKANKKQEKALCGGSPLVTWSVMLIAPSKIEQCKFASHSLPEIRVRDIDKATVMATEKIKWNLCSLVIVDGMAALSSRRHERFCRWLVGVVLTSGP
jgi:hypothetical protein